MIQVSKIQIWPLPLLCNECMANRSEFNLMNGEEVQDLCSVCMKDALFEFMQCNPVLTVHYEPNDPKSKKG